MISFSPKQASVRDALFNGMVDVNNPLIVSGPVQSGKTNSAMNSYLAWAAKNWSGYDFGLFCRSQVQLDGVLKKYAQEFGEATGLGWIRREDHYEQSSVYGDAPNKFYTALGHDKASEGRVRGLTLAGALVDEATLMADKFIETVFDRCSPPFSAPIFICNPAGPLHNLKTTYIDTGNCVHIPFDITDNPIMPTSFVESLKTRYGEGTPMYRRMALGEWAATEGAIFPDVHKAVGNPPDIKQIMQYDLSLDYADSSVTHALLMAQFPGVRWVLKEWRWDGRTQGQLHEETQAARIKRELVGSIPLGRIVVDPGALRMRKAMHKVFGKQTIAAVNDVIPGIQKVGERLFDGSLKINKECVHLIKDMSNYRWDEQAGAFGSDKPIKEDDHGPDALRYDVWTGTTPRNPVKAIYGNPNRRRYV